LAATFAELGYRRTTTAELARRCEVQETVLYRLWPDKKSMFLAAIEHVYRVSEETWRELLSPSSGSDTTADRLLEYESRHHGEHGLYRIVFAGLSETDDPEIRDTLQNMYVRFHRFIRRQVEGHRKPARPGAGPSADLTAWALIGLGTVANISREMGLLTDRRRKRLIREIGKALLEGRSG
jgi:AcrR family transcriptional regulator